MERLEKWVKQYAMFVRQLEDCQEKNKSTFNKAKEDILKIIIKEAKEGAFD